MASHTTDGNPKPTTPLKPPAASAHDGAIVLSLVGGQQQVQHAVNGNIQPVIAHHSGNAGARGRLQVSR